MGSALKNFLLRLVAGAVVAALFYALVAHLPDFARVILLLVAIVVIWRDPVFPKRTAKSYANLLFWLPIALGLFCGVVWKITGQEVWINVGLACISARAAYRIYPLPEEAKSREK